MPTRPLNWRLSCWHASMVPSLDTILVHCLVMVEVLDLQVVRLFPYPPSLEYVSDYMYVIISSNHNMISVVTIQKYDSIVYLI